MSNQYRTQPIQDFIKHNNDFAIIGHEEPDGDCVGSQLALAHFLLRMGKQAVPYSAGPYLRPEVLDYKEELSAGPLVEAQAVIILDCSTRERIGYFSDQIADLPIAVIDHHASGDPFGDIKYIDPKAPSVTYLIQQLIEESGEKPDQYEAELLFFGLCTDTGFFRHLEAGTPGPLNAASRLVASGASPKAAFARMYGNRSHSSRRLLGRLLDRAEARFDGRLLVTWENMEDLEEFGKLDRDSDSLFRQLQGIRNCQVAILIRQEDAETCSISLRSSNHIDVGVVAKKFGGGGHPGAAGFSSTESLIEIRDKVIEHFTDIFQL
jgi:bifunctional oligoribonuclease and PAP phosphatase NrnA